MIARLLWRLLLCRFGRHRVVGEARRRYVLMPGQRRTVACWREIRQECVICESELSSWEPYGISDASDAAFPPELERELTEKGEVVVSDMD